MASHSGPVESGEIVVKYDIYAWQADPSETDYFTEGFKYEWRTGSGDESDEFFTTAKEAVDDLKIRLT